MIKKTLIITGWMVVMFSLIGLGVKTILTFSKNTSPPLPTPIKEQPIETEEDSLIEQLYPISVIEVNKSTYKGYKWEVTAENGVVYQTNNKPKIGDPAFYIGDDSETLYWTK